MENLKSSVNDYEQRVFIKISVLMELSASYIHDKLEKALGRSALPLRTVQYWAKEFREGRMEAEKEDRFDCSFWAPPTSCGPTHSIYISLESA
jgi:hypothetical protein